VLLSLQGKLIKKVDIDVPLQSVGKECLEASNLIATLNAEHKIKCYDLKTLEETLVGPVSQLPAEAVTALSTFTQNGKDYLLVASAQKVTLRIYQVTNATLTKVFECRHASSQLSILANQIPFH
jgi:hypothetical protein